MKRICIHGKMKNENKEGENNNVSKKDVNRNVYIACCLFAMPSTLMSRPRSNFLFMDFLYFYFHVFFLYTFSWIWRSCGCWLFFFCVSHEIALPLIYKILGKCYIFSVNIYIRISKFSTHLTSNQTSNEYHNFFSFLSFFFIQTE